VIPAVGAAQVTAVSQAFHVNEARLALMLFISVLVISAFTSTLFPFFAYVEFVKIVSVILIFEKVGIFESTEKSSQVDVLLIFHILSYAVRFHE